MKINSLDDCREIKIKCNLDKVDFSAGFIKKVYKIAAYLNKRYDFNSDNVLYEHSFENKEEAKNNLITISLKFYYEEK